MPRDKLSGMEASVAWQLVSELEGLSREEQLAALHEAARRTKAARALAHQLVQQELGMSIHTIKDHEGNKLKRVLLQIVDKDAQGPITLHVGRDHEKFDLSDPKQREFLIVWAAEDQVLGELRLTDLIEDFEKIKAQSEAREKQREQLSRDIENMGREVARLEERDRTMAEELRQLKKAQDPERFATAVKEAVATRTAELEQQVKVRNTRIGEQDREIEELRASKRRLKEANERLKQGRE